MNFGGNNIMWILILLLILGDGNGGCSSCDTFIWLLLLSRYCGGDGDCGCGGNGTIGRSCGC